MDFRDTFLVGLWWVLCGKFLGGVAKGLCSGCRIKSMITNGAFQPSRSPDRIPRELIRLFDEENKKVHLAWRSLEKE